MYFIDLFAGAGGLSEGFIQAGYEPISHIELDGHAAFTLRTRMVFHYLREQNSLDHYYDYVLGKITREELYSFLPSELHEVVLQEEIKDETIDPIFRSIRKNMERVGCKDVDVLIGGPPCQAYSLVGRARDPYGKERDPRNHLYKQYVKFLYEFKPRMFVFENVPGILNAAKGTLFADVKKYMDDAGYDIEPRILNAADFGVLQSRKRVILIGWVKGTNFGYPDFVRDQREQNYLVDNILSDLPPIEPGHTVPYGQYTNAPNAYLEMSGIRSERDVLIQHVTRSHNERDREIYRLAINLWNQDKKRIKYTEVPESLRTHKNLHAFLDRFKVVGADLPSSHTMVAHIAKDGHYYIHPDVQQLRSLSVREAARIQSFPDNFYFEGPRAAKFTQIGNAVPPLMAKMIALEIKTMLLHGSILSTGTAETSLSLV